MAASSAQETAGPESTPFSDEAGHPPSTIDMDSWLEVTRKTAVILNSKLTVESYWTQGTRPDGRLFSQCRPASIQRRVLLQPGSALVKLGSMRVLAAISLQVGQIVTNPDVTVTIAGCEYDASALQSYLERILYDTLDLNQLLVGNQSAFQLNVSLQILNMGTTEVIRDICLLASVAALSDTRLPSLVWENGRAWLDVSNASTTALQLPVLPLPLTLGVVDGHQLLVDPSAQEQTALQTLVTIVVDGRNTSSILSVELAGLQAVDSGILVQACQLAQGRAQELASILM